ncbi:MAG: molybdopterin-dependent oxidoreductase [Nocardioides sp.]
MRNSRYVWPGAGLVAGLAGLAVSYGVAMVVAVGNNPVTAVAQSVIKILPGSLAEQGVQILGKHDKPVLVGIVLAGLVGLFVVIGKVARRNVGYGVAGFLILAGVGLAAIVSAYSFTLHNVLPLVAGYVVWVLALAWLASRLRDRHTPERKNRRGFLLGAGVMLVASSAVAVAGQAMGAGRQKVEQARRSIKLPHAATEPPPPPPPAAADVAVWPEGLADWQTSNHDFYRIDTAIVAPAITPDSWSLRIHGLVDNPVTLTYQDLLNRPLVRNWMTLNCVSNPVGGSLVGNAYWGGVLLRDILDEVGIQPGADAIKQSSQDGWTCGTPISAMTDPGRQAMLAIAMNGEPLPIEHGYPVRTVVPGLYGFVSACKWVTDFEVTRFSNFSAFWTVRGWSEQAPVKLASRIDTPQYDDQVMAGTIKVGGFAWEQHVGIKAVEVSLDGGPWQEATLGQHDHIDSWAQWRIDLDVGPGDHIVRVRAIDDTGRVQTGVPAEVAPNGASGWHTVQFKAVMA